MAGIREERAIRAKRGPTLRAQWLGQQLRDLREAAGLRLSDAGEYLQRSQGTVSRFESGDYPIRRGDMLALLDLYRVSEERRRNALMTLSEETWRKGWWDGYTDDVAGTVMDYVWVESRAHSIHTFGITPIPGLLQTKKYAETLIRTADPYASDKQLDRWVELRTGRQRVFEREDAPHVSVVLDEAGLRRQVGGREIMLAQLEHLLERARSSIVDLRVLPDTAGAHACPDGAFSLLEMPEPFPDVAYVETPAGGVYVEEPSTDRFAAMYDRLWETALGPAETAELISARAKELQ